MIKGGFKKFLNLSFYLAKTGFKLRNEGSYLGIFWYLLNPLLLFGLLFLIFNKRLGTGIEQYALYLFLGIIMFNFFQSVTSESTKIIRNHKSIFKSIKFQGTALILSSTLKFLFSHIFEIVVFSVLLVAFGGNMANLLFYPAILFFFMLFVFGASLILSSISVYFIDLENIWDFALRILWFVTPLFYMIERDSGLFAMNLINPLYYFIAAARDIVIYNRTPETFVIAGIACFGIIFLVVGLKIFKKLELKFAENM